MSVLVMIAENFECNFGRVF